MADAVQVAYHMEEVNQKTSIEVSTYAMSRREQTFVDANRGKIYDKSK